jgi:hypothetical protein
MAQYTSSTRVGSPRSGRFAVGDTFTDANGKSFVYGDDRKWHAIPSGSGGISSDEFGLIDQANNVEIFALEEVAGLTVSIQRTGACQNLRIEFDGVEITLTDAEGSGSSGSLELGSFLEGWGVLNLGCVQHYESIHIAPEVTADGDASIVMGVGTAQADAGDGALTGAERNIGDVTDAMVATPGAVPATDGGTASGNQVSQPAAGPSSINAFDAAVPIYLNVSGTAATVDGTGVITVTGHIHIGVLMLDTEE